MAAVTDPKSAPLCIGDLICLYSEERFGYVMSYQSSCTNNELAIQPNQPRDAPVVPNVHALVFKVCVPQRYRFTKKAAALKASVEANSADIVLQTQYSMAVKAAESEKLDNIAEQERQTGKPVLYGQAIQLNHLFTNKWVHMDSIQTSTTEHNNFMVGLQVNTSRKAVFKVLPRYKVKQEGEIITLGDQVVFESFKAAGNYLHAGRSFFGQNHIYTNCHELNLSSRLSGFTTVHFHHPIVPKKKDDKDKAVYVAKMPLKGGNYVRIFHREVDAYVTLEGINSSTGEDIHLRVRPSDPTNPKTLYPSSSAINFWQIEKEQMLDGDELSWADYVRFRHVVTRQYLTVSKSGQLKMVASADELHDCHVDTLFRLHPVVKEDVYATMDSTVRIQHVATGMWLQGKKDEPYVPRSSSNPINGIMASTMRRSSSQKSLSAVDDNAMENLPWTTAERRQLMTANEMTYDDAFTIQGVEQTIVEDVNYIAGVMPFMHKLGTDIMDQNTILESKAIARYEMAMNEVCDFIFIDGIANKNRQKLLRNFMLVDLCVLLLKRRAALHERCAAVVSGTAAAVRAAIVDKQTLSSQLDALEPLFAAQMRLLNAYVNGESRKNELYLGRHLDFFLTQIGDTQGFVGLTATEMAVGLMRNNRVLIDRITPKQMEIVCALVTKHINCRYLDLLSALCVCDGVSITRNQDKIAHELLVKPFKTGRNVFLVTELGQNIGRRKNVVYISWDHGRSWTVLHEFTTQSYGTDYYMYFKYQLMLFGSLCSGRNYTTAELLTKQVGMIPWEECYVCLTDGKLSDEIRSIYCQLLYELYINIGTNFVSQDVKLVYVYEQVALPGQRRTSLRMNESETGPIPLSFMEPLKLWINDFLHDNDEMVASDIGRNTLLSEVLEVVRKLALLGYYGDFKQVKAVLDPIMGLLDGSDDLPYHVENLEFASLDVKQLVESYRLKGRYERNTRNAAVVSVKVSALHAAELLFNLRSAARLDRFVSHFKAITSATRDFSQTTIHAGSETNLHPLDALLYESYDATDGQISGLNETAVALVRRMFAETDYVSPEFVAVGMDLFKYEFNELVAEATFLVHRYYSSFDDLFNYATQTQLLVTERSVQVQRVVSANLRQLRLMVADRNITVDDAYRMKELIDEFTELCYLDGDPHGDCHPINQQIIYNFGVLGDIFDVVTGQIDTDKEVLAEVFKSSFMLLMAMAKGNPMVQMRLFDRMSTFLKYTASGVQDHIAALFVEIFSGNQSLCLRVSAELVTQIVTNLASSRSPTLIRLLSALVMINGKPLKRNQQLVVKVLLQYKRSISIVMDRPAHERLQLMATDERSGTKKSEEQRYMANIVQLLAYCSTGDNKIVESICQTLFTLNELMDIILLPNLCNGLRSPFVLFLVNVFLTSDLDTGLNIASLSHESRLWRYIELLCQEITKVATIVNRQPVLCKSLLKQKLLKIHIDKQNLEHELQETLHYVFDTAIPFLLTFFKHTYQKTADDSLADSQLMSGGAEGGDDEGDFAETVDKERRQLAQLLHLALLPLADACHAGRLSLGHGSSHYVNLVSTIHAITELADISESMPMQLNAPPPPTEDDPLLRYRSYYAEEIQLNMLLCTFVQNLRWCYGGPNTVRYQLGYPSDKEYTNVDGDYALPLGVEFQQMVEAFLKDVDPEVKEADVEAYLQAKYENIRYVIRHIGVCIGTNPIDRMQERQDEVVLRSLMMLRALLHNEIVKLDDEHGSSKKSEAREQSELIEAIQSVLVEMNIIDATLEHLLSKNENLLREVLALLATMLYGGSKVVQDRFMLIFLGSREEAYFTRIKERMQITEEALRERRMLVTKPKRRTDLNAAVLARLKSDDSASLNNRKETMIDPFYHPQKTTPFGADGATNSDSQRPGMLSKLLAKFFPSFGQDSPTDTAEDGLYAASTIRQNRPTVERRHDCLHAVRQVVSATNRFQHGTSSSPADEIGANLWSNVLRKTMLFELIQGDYVKDAVETSKSSGFRDVGYLNLVLQVMAAMCDGQNTQMQEYYREQTDNLKTVDLVGSICDLFPLFLSQLDISSIEIVTQLIDTLIEMIQGNEDNQVDAFDHRAVDHANHILRLRLEDIQNCSLNTLFALKRSISIFLIDMTEENTESQHTTIIMDAVSKDDLFNSMTHAYKLLQQREKLPELVDEDLVMTVGFNFHHLLCRAFDLDPNLDREKYCVGSAWEYFMAHTLSIELKKEDNLQRVYFTVEDKDVLRESVKERLKWEVDRSSPSNKLRGFMEWAREICDDIRYQRRVQSHALGRFLVNNWTLLNISVLLLTFILNLIVLFGWFAPEKFQQDYQYDVKKGAFRPEVSSRTQTLLQILGYVHIFLSTLLLASFLLANRPTVPAWLKAFYYHSRDWVYRRLYGRPWAYRPAQRFGEHLTVDILSWDGMYYPLLLVMSILGNVYGGAFFSFHMLHIVNQNQLLRRVMQAVTLNGLSMLWVCFLGAIFFYIYALIGFLFLRNIYLFNQLYCHTMFECFVATLRNGLMFGMADHFDISDDDENNTFNYYAIKAIFDVSFFALITTIGLNMIFGIIIDTFSQLREAKLQIEEDMREVCFICNCNSYEFEHRGAGFGKHVVDEHNMWAYLFFFIHLSDTLTNDLTSLELYVHQMIEEDGIDFFPLGRALTLSRWEEVNADTRMQQVVEQIQYLVDRIKEQEVNKEREAMEQSRQAKKAVAQLRRKTELEQTSTRHKRSSLFRGSSSAAATRPSAVVGDSDQGAMGLSTLAGATGAVVLGGDAASAVPPPYGPFMMSLSDGQGPLVGAAASVVTGTLKVATGRSDVKKHF